MFISAGCNGLHKDTGLENTFQTHVTDNKMVLIRVFLDLPDPKTHLTRQRGLFSIVKHRFKATVWVFKTIVIFGALRDGSL